MEVLSWSLSTLTLLLWVFYVVFGLFIFHFPKVFYLLDWTPSGRLLHFVHWKRKNAKDFIQDKWVIVYLMYAYYTVSIVLASFFLHYFFFFFFLNIVSRRNSTVLCSYAQTLLPSRSPIGNCHCSTEYNLPLEAVCLRQRHKMTIVITLLCMWTAVRADLVEGSCSV